MLGAFAGTIVEVGAGTGVNMRYYAPGIHLIAIEPSPHMHERLRSQAEKHSVDLEIRTLRGEQIDVADETADAVVATLVLCGVDDPRQVVAEVRRDTGALLANAGFTQLDITEVDIGRSGMYARHQIIGTATR